MKHTTLNGVDYVVSRTRNNKSELVGADGKLTTCEGNVGGSEQTNLVLTPGHIPFKSRPRDFLDDLRRRRGLEAFKPGPSKARKTRESGEPTVDGAPKQPRSRANSGSTPKRTRKAKTIDPGVIAKLKSLPAGLRAAVISDLKLDITEEMLK